MTSPTQLTLASLREQGYLAEVVERWIPGANIHRDLWGFVDILAVLPRETDGLPRVLAIQCTTASNLSARYRKVLASPNILTVTGAGITVQVWGWAKRGPRGGRKVWTRQVREVSW